MSDEEFAFRWHTGRFPYGPRRMLRGLKTRIVASIAILAAGLVFVVCYLGFFATHFAWYANVAVVLSTIIVVPAALIVMWVLWGLGVSGRFLRDVDKDW